MKKLSLAILPLVFLPIALAAQVRAWEGPIEYKTYVYKPAEVAPVFEFDYNYQQARRSVYPMQMNDNNMCRDWYMKAYDALFLENEYVKLCVIPELGGRLMWALDKTNGYDIFYNNGVVKPANVGMCGAWISGGVEWNTFHHHRQTTYTPCDWRIEQGADGSKTIWVGESERRHRMQWAIGITLHPGKSYIEISGRLINSTQDDNSMLYWSNVSTLVDENYQIIFPPSVNFVTYHCKDSFAHWPVTHETFNGMDMYQNNVDASWWKNHYNANSMFAHDLKEDFIGGYDHGRDAGTMLVGNHNIVKGGKFWLWGPNSGWDTEILTDDSGHYCELMVGAYSDNQPDYNWSGPYEMKSFSQYWYGVRNLGGMKAGDTRAVINMDMTSPGHVFVGANATEKIGRVTLSLKKGDEILFEKSGAISPDKPLIDSVFIDKSIKETELRLVLSDAAGCEMLSYQPVIKDADAPLPEPVRPPLKPAQIKNTEECYLVGLRNLQFHHPFVNPTDYFLEVLRRDPDDTRANTQMGVWYRKRGDYDKAASYLRRAIRRQTKDYTRPKDCEAMYNLGLVLKAQGKYEEAMDTLYRATWTFTYNSAANLQLAQMYASAQDCAMAEDRLREAIVFNGNNLTARCMYASLLRRAGRKAEASAQVAYVLGVDPLNAYAMHESLLLGGRDSFHALMRDEAESYLELAIQYWNNGLAEEAVKVLKDIDSRVVYPTVKMWLGFIASSSDETLARNYYDEALAAKVPECNPFRLETIDVLRLGMKYHPENDILHYYLGNLLYNKQQDAAYEQWQECVRLNPSNDLGWRNMGWYNWMYAKDYEEAVRDYRKAIEINPDSPLYFEELDQLYQKKGEDVSIRYETLKSHHETAKLRYNPFVAEVNTGIYCGDYEYVMDLLDNSYFPTKEGVPDLHQNSFTECCLLYGMQKASEGKWDEAIALYEKSFTFPENQQVFVTDFNTPHDAETYYLIAQAYAGKGNEEKAAENYQKSLDVDLTVACRMDKTSMLYWKGLSSRALGDKKTARATFKSLIKTGKAEVTTDYVNFFGGGGSTGTTFEMVNSVAWYHQGLGYLGLGRKAAARKCFRKALSFAPHHLMSHKLLETLQ